MNDSDILKKYITTDKKFFNIKNISILIVLAIIYWLAAKGSELSITELIKGLPYMHDFLSRMWPPNIAYTLKVFWPLIETIEVAIWGTTFAILGAIPLGFLAAKNIAPPLVFWVSRAVLNFCRAINEIISGLIFVSLVGLGPFPGTSNIYLPGSVAI